MYSSNLDLLHSPEVHSLDTDRAVPETLEGALLLRSAGLGALEAEALGTRPAERPCGIAERKARVVNEAESHARRHCDGWVWRLERRGRGKKGGKAGDRGERVFRRGVSKVDGCAPRRCN